MDEDENVARSEINAEPGEVYWVTVPVPEPPANWGVARPIGGPGGTCQVSQAGVVLGRVVSVPARRTLDNRDEVGRLVAASRTSDNAAAPDTYVLTLESGHLRRDVTDIPGWELLTVFAEVS